MQTIYTFGVVSYTTWLIEVITYGTPSLTPLHYIPFYITNPLSFLISSSPPFVESTTFFSVLNHKFLFSLPLSHFPNISKIISCYVVVNSFHLFFSSSLFLLHLFEKFLWDVGYLAFLLCLFCFKTGGFYCYYELINACSTVVFS